MKRILLLGLFLIALLPVGSQAVADTITCPTTDDVYIDSGKPMENFNYKTRVLISWHSSHGTARGLWKFTIPGSLTVTQIESATLHLSGAYNTGGGMAINVSCYALNSPFSEATETWNTHSGGDYDTSVFSSGALPAGNDWETTIDVTALLAGNLSKVRDYGMLMRLTNESGANPYQNIAAKESTDPKDFAAYLEIVYFVPSSTTTVQPTTTTSSSSSSSSSSSIQPTSSSTSSTTSIQQTTSSSSSSSSVTSSEQSTSSSVPSTTTVQPTTTVLTTTTVEQTTTTTTIEPSTTTTEEPPATTTSEPEPTTTSSEPGTTTTSSSKTTTTARPRLCAIARLFPDDGSIELEALRLFRDKRLSQSSAGLLLCYLYYAHSEEVAAILSINPELAGKTRNLIINLAPLARESLLFDHDFILTKTRYDEITELMALINDRASPDLRKTIAFIQRQLGDDAFLKTLRIVIEKINLP